MQFALHVRRAGSLPAGARHEIEVVFLYFILSYQKWQRAAKFKSAKTLSGVVTFFLGLIK